MQKYLYLAQQLLSHGAQTLDELRKGWAKYDPQGKAMACSTFYDNRRILAERFGIHLQQDSHRRYHLQQSHKEGADLLLYLIDGATEKAPSPIEVWQPLLQEACKERYVVRLHYASLHRPHYETLFSPYVLHTSQGRHYVLGHSSLHNSVRTFALDRIRCVQTTPQRFTRPLRTDFFAHSVGAMSGEVQHPALVRLAVRGITAELLRSMPLHSSQQEVEPGIFEFGIVPDAELLRHLLSFGSDATVLAPESLQQAMQEQIAKMQALYTKEKAEP